MTDTGWIGTRHIVTVDIEPQAPDPMRGIVGNETARIVGAIYCPRRGVRDAMGSVTRRARELYGPTAYPLSGELVYPGDPIEHDVIARVRD